MFCFPSQCFICMPGRAHQHRSHVKVSSRSALWGGRGAEFFSCFFTGARTRCPRALLERNVTVCAKKEVWATLISTIRGTSSVALVYSLHMMRAEWLDSSASFSLSRYRPPARISRRYRSQQIMCDSLLSDGSHRAGLYATKVVQQE
jgi:hypothetical protein